MEAIARASTFRAPRRRESGRNVVGFPENKVQEKEPPHTVCDRYTDTSADPKRMQSRNDAATLFSVDSFRSTAMHPILVLASASALFLSACTTSPAGWQKDGAPMSTLERDKAQCTYEAKAATASYRGQPSKPGEAAAMGAAIGDGVVIAEKQIELTNDCMRARGYAPTR